MDMLDKHPLHQFKYCPKCGSDSFVVNNEKSKKCHNCQFVYYFNSCAATVALIINDQNELLVATRSAEPAIGTFDLPGGFVDMNETGEESMAREIKEETNLDILELRYLFSIPNRYMYSNFEVHTLDMVYLCKVSAKQEIVAADDVSKLEYIKISELNPILFGLQSIRTIIENINTIKI